MLKLEEREESLVRSGRDMRDAMDALRMAASAIEAADAAAFPEGNALARKMSDEISRGVRRLGHEEEEAREGLEQGLRAIRGRMDAEEEAYGCAARKVDEGGGGWQ